MIYCTFLVYRHEWCRSPVHPSSVSGTAGEDAADPLCPPLRHSPLCSMGHASLQQLLLLVKVHFHGVTAHSIPLVKCCSRGGRGEGGATLAKAKTQQTPNAENLVRHQESSRGGHPRSASKERDILYLIP